MNYKQLIEDAKSKGLASEKIMWESVEGVSDMLCVMKKEHPEMYWSFIRKQHGMLYKGHYTEVFARHDVEKIVYQGRDGKRKSGPYWTCEQIEEVTKGLQFSAGVNIWDKYVAYNVLYSDLCKKLDDNQILDAAYLFFFADEDWPSPSTKIWNYMCCKFSL